mgnify:CR=1 FL=1
MLEFFNIDYSFFNSSILRHYCLLLIIWNRRLLLISISIYVKITNHLVTLRWVSADGEVLFECFCITRGDLVCVLPGITVEKKAHSESNLLTSLLFCLTPFLW